MLKPDGAILVAHGKIDHPTGSLDATTLIQYFAVYTNLLVKYGFLLVPAKSRLGGIILPT
jgi:hypothetical protein